MEYQAQLLALALMKEPKFVPSLGRAFVNILLSAVVVWALLFSAGAAVDAMKVKDEPRQAISSAVLGPVALSCAHIRWCAKPIPPKRIFDYPLAVVDFSVM